MEQNKLILFSGGGTGGHIYPALAMAEAVKKLDATARVEFVGTPTGLEAKLVPHAGFRLHFISIGRLNRNVGWRERLTTLIALPFAMVKSFWLILRLRPSAVVGVGGYASGPIVLAAALMRVRAYIWEPNAYPGLANRILARFVSGCLVVFTEAGKMLKNGHIAKVHMPVRREIEALNPGVSTAEEFHLLVFGGSQGSRALNNVLIKSIGENGAWLKNVRIVHQTGPVDYARLLQEYAKIPLARDFVEVHEYLHDMPKRLAWADLVIARAGTGTISELAACGKPAILVPLPTAADDHQTKNAEALVKVGAAVMIPQSEFTPERLAREVEGFKNHREKLLELSQNIRRLHQSDAAMQIAKIVLNETNHF